LNVGLWTLTNKYRVSFLLLDNVGCKKKPSLQSDIPYWYDILIESLKIKIRNKFLCFCFLDDDRLYYIVYEFSSFLIRFSFIFKYLKNKKRRQIAPFNKIQEVNSNITFSFVYLKLKYYIYLVR
jgi:hypothetical protein